MAGAENKLTLPYEVVGGGEQISTSVEATQPLTGTAVPKESMPPCASPGNPIFSCMEKLPQEIPQHNSEEWFEGYEQKPQHPMYMTTNMTYGSKPPSVHTMPTSFHARTQKFSEPLGKCGMYRNKGLNTGMDVSRV
ncbi:piercer of microtubule wall 1 protein-like isoform X2 [Glandiceps talaboti]